MTSEVISVGVCLESGAAEVGDGDLIDVAVESGSSPVFRTTLLAANVIPVAAAAAPITFRRVTRPALSDRHPKYPRYTCLLTRPAVDAEGGHPVTLECLVGP